MRRKTTTRPYRNLVGLLAINILSIFVQSLSFAQIVPHYVIQLESARKESQGHFSAFSYGETFKWDHNCSHLFFFRNCPIFGCPFMYFLLFVAHRYFCCPQVWGTCGKPSVEGNHRLLGNHNCRRVGTSEVDIWGVEYWILKKHGRNIDDVGLDFSGQYWKKKST